MSLEIKDGKYLLPMEDSDIELSIAKQIFLIYGRPKIGKSTFAKEFPAPFFISTEPGLNHLKCRKQDVRTWKAFLMVCSALKTQPYDRKTIVIDTLDKLVTMCQDYICEKLNIPHVSEYKKYGAWHEVTGELDRVLHALADMGYALVMITHEKTISVKERSGDYDRKVFSITGKNAEVIQNLPDHILLMDSAMKGDEEVRFIRTQGSKYWTAGSRNEKLQAAGAIELSYKALAKFFTD